MPNLNKLAEESIVFKNKPTWVDLAMHHFDDCFELLEEKRNTFILKGRQYELEISTDLSDFSYFQIYTPKDRKSIAIEPMTCAPNAFNNGLGLRKIDPEGSFCFTYQLQAFVL